MVVNKSWVVALSALGFTGALLIRRAMNADRDEDMLVPSDQPWPALKVVSEHPEPTADHSTGVASISELRRLPGTSDHPSKPAGVVALDSHGNAGTSAAVVAIPTEEDTIWAPARSGECPPGYPVKVKLSSRLYHLPGMSAYSRTRPDRCYRSPEAAEADGFTRAKR